MARFVDGNYAGADGLYVSGTPDTYGEVTPAYGVHDGYVAGQSYQVSAPATVEFAAGNVAKCVGYTVTTNGGVYVQGSGNTFAYVHPDWPFGAVLTWNWEATEGCWAGLMLGLLGGDVV